MSGLKIIPMPQRGDNNPRRLRCRYSLLQRLKDTVQVFLKVNNFDIGRNRISEILQKESSLNIVKKLLIKI